jgi:phosphoglycerate dehydrogenase-like enzyme
MTELRLLLPAALRVAVESRLPTGVAVSWVESASEAQDAIEQADVAWLDLLGLKNANAILQRARQLKWLFTLGAGVEYLDFALLKRNGTTLTNGSGLNATAVADYAVMGVLACAKRFDKVLEIAATRQWTADAPGKMELEGSRALILGMGTIGRRIADRLKAFGVSVTGVTRRGGAGLLDAQSWQARLGDHDWIIVAAPATSSTRAIIGPAQLASMKQTAWLINIARGSLVDQDALCAALHAGRIGGAFLDTVTPEPLPPEHPLWRAPNCMITMHLSGRSQTSLPDRAQALFLENLDAYLDGRPLLNVVDLAEGY